MKRILAIVALLALATGLLAFDTRPTPDCADGTPIQLVLPAREHMQNVGGSDGSGLCVYTSVTLAAKFQNVTEMFGLRKFAEGRPGGSYPEKLDADIKLYAQRAGVTAPSYVQHTGGDDAFLDLCIATRRMPGITYAGVDDFYSSPILHMVNLVHLDSRHGAIQDNNRAGKWTSDTRQKILYRWKGLDDNGKDLLVPSRQGLRTVWVPAGGGWAFCWLGAPPPPRPPVSSEKNSTTESDRCRHCGHWERTTLADDRHAWVYWSNGEAVGAFCDGVWYTVTHVSTDDGFGKTITLYTLLEKGEAPAGLSPPEGEPTDDWNKGVDSWKFDRRNRYWINGVEVSRAKAYAAVADPGGLTDDSDKYHFSVVGADKKTVLAWFGPSGVFADYARRVHVQVYDKAAWPTEYLHAAVTIQEPAKMGGKVVAIATEYTEGACKKALASIFDTPVAPKPVDPVKPVDPIKPVDPVKPVDPAPAPAPAPAPSLPGWLIALLAALALLIFKGKK